MGTVRVNEGTSHSKKNLFSVFIFERHRETETDRDLPTTRSLSKCLQNPGPDQAKARSLEHNLGLPHGQRGCNRLSHHLLSFRVHTSKKLESEVKPDSNPGIRTDCRCPDPWPLITTVPNAHPNYLAL